MPNYNEGHYYNQNGEANGLFYNTDYQTIVKIVEDIDFSENISRLSALISLKDTSMSAKDSALPIANYGLKDKFTFVDSASRAALYKFAENFGVADKLSSLIALATLYEKQDILDDVNQLYDIIMDDSFSLGDDMSLTALFEMLDDYGLYDLEYALFYDIFLNENLKIEEQVKQFTTLTETDRFSMSDKASMKAAFSLMEKHKLNDLKSLVETLYVLHDRESITDGKPRSAVSDFIIGVTDDYDNAYDWLLPFGMKIDWNTTNIQVMPEASSTVIEMPGIDGSIVEDTTYKDRLFSIVAFSEDGLTEIEKQDIKSKITDILDATKHKSKKLTVQASGNSFDVKYDGKADIVEGQSYVKATIPFRTSPYGYKTFEGEIYGNGLVYNEGDAPVGPRHTIIGPVSNPYFTLGDIFYEWKGEIPRGYTLVIDHQMMTCYLMDEFGVKKNAMTSLSGNFQKIPAHTSVALDATKIPTTQFITTWRDKVLW